MSTRRATLFQGACIAAICAAALAVGADFREPPRYDGAGYAVLAQSLATGRGYRAIDQPAAPRHAHFPPGYPITLAALWTVTGPSFVAAHAFSFACTLGATMLAWLWFRSWSRPCEAFLMALALAINWRWSRDGTAIRSEPLFLLLGQAALLATDWVKGRGGIWRDVSLGVLLGAAILTRHVALALAVAICVDLWMSSRRRESFLAFASSMLVVTPWAVWLTRVPGDTQVEHIPVRGLGATLASNGLFYVRRLVDQIIGPVIEVATVFASRFATGSRTVALIGAVATLCAVVACLPILAGWMRLARRPRSRLAGLVPGLTLAMLLAWPFTEAGRFLVPLIPFLIAGATEGLAMFAGRWKIRRARLIAARVVLALAIPYALYSLITSRAAAERATHRGFDAACAWIAAHPIPAGPVLSRRPGEVFLQTGRTGIPPIRGRVIDQLEGSGIAFVLDDSDRFAHDATSPNTLPLLSPADLASGRVELAASWPGVDVYRVRIAPPNPD